MNLNRLAVSLVVEFSQNLIAKIVDTTQDYLLDTVGTLIIL